MNDPKPPEGWFVLGSHVGFEGPLEFSDALDEAGLPLWERHPTQSGMEAEGGIYNEQLRAGGHPTVSLNERRQG